ncbi:hypothetical protein [Aeromonas caviae]|uniref:hypothetical protein n=1 Tax=Aeromonas caviae TaxID=648 RepID=UPI003F78B340
MKSDFSKVIRKPVVWGSLLAVVAIGGGIQGRKFMDSLTQDEVVSEQSADPVYYPPQRVEPSAVVIESAPATAKVVFDDELLQRARSYRLSKIKAMEDELSKKSDVAIPFDGQLSGGLMAPPAPPSGVPLGEQSESNPLGVSMVVMGQVPMAWLSKGGDQPQSGRVGETVYGKRIVNITPDRVCFSDKSCLRVN